MFPMPASSAMFKTHLLHLIDAAMFHNPMICKCDLKFCKASYQPVVALLSHYKRPSLRIYMASGVHLAFDKLLIPSTLNTM